MYEKIAGSFDSPSGKLVIGIDGCIDEVWEILASRNSRDDFTVCEKISHFCQDLATCGEGGYSKEIIRKRRSAGGFTVNTGKTASRLGCDVTMIGLFGSKNIDPIFQEPDQEYRLVSVGDPGRDQNYEFTDGKIMFVHIEDTIDFDWQSILCCISEAELKELFDSADIIGLGYWSLLPAFDEIVERTCDLIRDNGRKQRMFFDFADIRKKDRSTLHETLSLLAELNKQVPMMLSLNEHEAALLFSYYGETFGQDKTGADRQTEKIRSLIGLDELIVHTPYFAAAASAEEGSCVREQHYCTSPVLTVGAGDNFNAGYLAAALNGLGIEERITVANAVTYQFISNGRPPDKKEMLAEVAANLEKR